MRLSWILAVLIAGPVWAEEFAIKKGDTPFERDALDTRLRGEVLEFYDDGQAKYYVDGRYSYTYAGSGSAAYGYWDINPEGAICVEFLNETTRCDFYVMNGDRMILITQEGHRFPVRP
ncbi:MAG: hypothetical protein ACRBB0_19015 [Pelagimonas sp.]|uniref:hypothetical protein n=1 Tax=Pelagimonas sp. TaxID=2073170 RepID=UPI003D6B95E4